MSATMKTIAGMESEVLEIEAPADAESRRVAVQIFLNTNDCSSQAGTDNRIKGVWIS